MTSPPDRRYRHSVSVTIRRLIPSISVSDPTISSALTAPSPSKYTGGCVKMNDTATGVEGMV